MDKADKRARLKAWREQERSAAQLRLPLPDPEMEALFGMLDEALSKHGCDHSRRLTDAWLAQRGHAMEPVHRWLDDTGGYCDCEVLMNSEQVWQDAARGSQQE